MDLQKKERESGIELLRIILMLQVVFLHVCCYGTYTEFGVKAGGLHSLLYWTVMMLSRTPVYMYIVIMGYFMINKDLTMKDAFRKIKSVYLSVFFYSVAIWLVVLIGQHYSLGWADAAAKASDIPNIFRAFLPITAKNWPFMTTYVLVLFFAPFINRALKDISKSTYTLLVGVLFFMFSIWILLSVMEPTKEVFSLDKIIGNDGGKSLYAMIFMYILGGYVRRFAPRHEKARVRYLVMGLGLALLNVLLVYKVPGYKDVVLRNDNPISIILGIMWIMYFKDLKFRSKIVNYIAKHNLGVYIIHEHHLMRPIIWNYIVVMNVTTFYATKWYPFKILGIAIGVFVVCGVIDALRVKLFQGIGFLWQRLYNKSETK